MTEPTRIILFGLSANPPTGLGGHAGLVQWAATEARLDEWGGAGADEVWVLPVYRHAYAAKREMAPFEHRLAMARLAFEHLPGLEQRVRVLDVERRAFEMHQRRSADSESVPALGTVDIVEVLRAEYPDAEFGLLLGADTCRDLLEGRWRRSEDLLRMLTVLAVPRKGVDAPVPVREGAPELDDISSSEVRDDPSRWPQVLQPEVEAYIRRHSLYGASEAPTNP